MEKRRKFRSHVAYTGVGLSGKRGEVMTPQAEGLLKISITLFDCTLYRVYMSKVIYFKV